MEKTTSAGRKLMLQASAFDLLLVLLVSTATVFTASYGFNSGEAVRGNVLLDAALCLPLLVTLFAGAWSKRMIPLSAGATILVSVLIVGACALASGSTPLFTEAGINDVPENYVIFGFVVVVCACLTYLLSRRPALCLILGLLILICMGLIQFMYRNWFTDLGGAPTFIAAFGGCTGLLIFQRYRLEARKATRSKKPAFGSAAAFGLVAGLACMGVAALLFVVLIEPLSLETAHIKLFQEYYQPPVVEYTGIYDKQDVDDPDRHTSALSEEVTTTNQNGLGGTDPNQTELEENSEAPQGIIAQLLSGFNPDDWAEQFNTIDYQFASMVALLVILALAALIILAAFARRSIRGRRIRQLEKVTLPYRVQYLTSYFEDRLQKLGFERLPDQTPMEYALTMREDMLPFAAGTKGVDFLKVTLICQRVTFGGMEPSFEDYEAVLRFYQHFFKNAQRHVGYKRWMLLFWII